MKMKFLLIFLLILVITVFFRGYQLGEVPPGLNIDEASQGYNAYSLLLTGKDRYEQTLPVIFRSFGSFQPPVYTYLTVLPVFLFGPTITAVHLVSFICGVGIVIMTFLIIYLLSQSAVLSLTSMLILAISPWSVFFSRIATEATTGLFFFVLGLLLLVASLKKSIKYFPLACLFMGIATHAYYSERIVGLLFLGYFIFLFWKNLRKHKYWLIGGLIVLGLTQLPHLYLLNQGAFSRRLLQVSYFGEHSLAGNIKEFASQYTAYWSPKNLFADPDPQGARSLPDLSVFYSFLIIPFLLGLKAVVKEYNRMLTKVILGIVVIGPIPASLTFDPFYSLRVLVFLWGISLIISLGTLEVFKAKSELLKIIIILLFFPSLFSLFRSLFILTKYERSEVYGYTYTKLLEETDKYPQKRFIVDSTRDLATGIRLVFFKRYDPNKLQPLLRSKLTQGYYSNQVVDEPYSVGNVTVRAIYWEEDLCQKNTVLVGDLLAFSDNQIKEHHLKFEFVVKDLAGEQRLKAYSLTKESCRIFPELNSGQ